MIAVDTNVLARLFIIDEPQSAIARKFFAQRSPDDPAYISLVVVAELVWVLKKRYRIDFETTRHVLSSMLASDDFFFEGRNVVEWALENFTRSRIDFSDLLVARLAELAGARATVTFDGDAAKFIPGMELLK